MKICDRRYGDASLYTMKIINAIPCCPACEKPAYCHGKSIEERALFWSLSDDTGTSSKTMAKWLGLGLKIGWSSPPSDASDRGRCIRLLELIPEWIPRLNELTRLDDSKDEGITISASGINAYHNSWADQIPLILSEGRL